MDRRHFLQRACSIAVAPVLAALGCRGHQVGHIVSDEQADMVGSHSAGAATFNPLVDEAVAKLLARQSPHLQPATFAGSVGPKRICFVGVENFSAEEIGDFKAQLYEQIDSMLLQSPVFEPISQRFIDAGLYQTRLRPDALFIPENMRMFTAALEQQGQPVDYLLYAKLTSGTTQNNHSYQRDYLLSLELIDVHTGHYDKESAKIRKGYHPTHLGKWQNYNPFKKP